MQSGRKQFKDWMKRREFNQVAMAKYFGWHESVISQYLSGDRCPNLENAVMIEDKTGIPVEAWLSIDVDESREAVPATSGNRRIHKA